MVEAFEGGKNENTHGILAGKTGEGGCRIHHLVADGRPDLSTAGHFFAEGLHIEANPRHPA